MKNMIDFYKKDNKSYELKRNKEFLNWLKNQIKNGYSCSLEIEEMQELIDNIAKWYEFKYPEKSFEKDKSNNIESITDLMSVEQFLFRLPSSQLSLLNGDYRAHGYSRKEIYRNGDLVGYKPIIFIHIDRKTGINPYIEKLPTFLIFADINTGDILKSRDLDEYVNKEESINLEELLKIYDEKYTESLDFSELSEVINNHKVDMELRKKLLKLAALKILYSKNTTPARGYERAKNFIIEFRKKLDIALSKKEIEEIINEEYIKNYSLSMKNIFFKK